MSKPALVGIVLWGAWGIGPALAAEKDPPPLFPFVVSYDTPDNVTNLSGWLPRPAGRYGFIRAADGHLATDDGPIRLWATNLCFEACFPSHEEARGVAARLASLGINCVRMHHMDSRNIWGDSPNHTTIDPKMLERLDNLIFQLKQHGIYTDLNLHVSRWLDAKDGFPARQQRPKYDKGLGNFEPRMIELQKKYARDLLTHVNPYTKTAYAQEPAVAMIEISNEDALFNIFNRGGLDDLPQPYAATYRRLWNEWLRKKYPTTERLRKAWNAGAWPLGKEMLADGDFSQPLEKHWSLQRDDWSQVTTTIEDGGPDGQRMLRLVVTRLGRQSWIPQLWHAGLAVKKGTPYTVSGYLRSTTPGKLGLNCMMAHQPWQRLGLSTNLAVGPEWKPFRVTFVAEQDDDAVRITFSSFRPATYEFAAISLRPGGIVGLEPGQNLEDATVPVLRRGRLNLTQAARHDFVDFLWDTERDYWWEMHRYLKEELGVGSLVSGTQLTYSPVHVQAHLDYIDAHAYWNHPVFPGRPWDGRNWYVRNLALVNAADGGTLSGLAVRRVAGMAYTVSEYNHPAPNDFAAEGFPMIAAFGRFQDWDGIFSFTYSHSREFQPRRITGYFDIKSHTAKLVHMPASAALFLRGDAAPARQTVTVSLSAERERRQLHETLSPRSLTADQLGLDPRISLLHAVALDLEGPAQAKLPTLPEDTTRLVSDTGQLHWDLSQPGAGYFLADTPRTKLFTGFVRGRTFGLGDVSLAIGPTRLDWATVSLVAVDGADFHSPGRILIAATGWVQNQNAQRQEVGPGRITLGNHWGEGPVLCEGIPATIRLGVPAGRVRFYPLDAAGNRRQAVPVEEQDGAARLLLDPAHQTLWYEAEIVE